MKHIVSTLLVLTVTLSLSTEALAAPAYHSKASTEMEMSALAGRTLTKEQASQIQSEIVTLSNCYIDTSVIERVNITPSGNEYILDYNNAEEKVSIEKNNDESVTIIADAGEITNVISIEKDGSIILDGYKVQISELDPNSNTLTRGSVWKSEKSLSPYGSLKASDYNKYLSAGKQNIGLGKALDNLTVTALSAVISSFNTYSGIAVSLATVAKGVYDVLVEVNPKTQYLGCAYTTYTCGASDYKYINKFYANKECTGKYKQEISYEHFIVY